MTLYYCHIFTDALHTFQSMHKTWLTSIILIMFLGKRRSPWSSQGYVDTYLDLEGGQAGKGRSGWRNKIKETSTQFTSQSQQNQANIKKLVKTAPGEPFKREPTGLMWSGRRNPKNMGLSSSPQRGLSCHCNQAQGPRPRWTAEVAFSAAVSACEKGTLGNAGGVGCAVGGYTWHITMVNNPIREGYSHKNLVVICGI